MIRIFCLAMAVAVALCGYRVDARYLFINEDNDHYFKFPSERMTREALEAYADSITASGKVTHVLFCACGQRASFDSKAWEPIWMGLGGADDNGRPHDNIWCLNAKKLHDAGIDPYEVWLARVRANGVKAWLSMRVHDLHGVEIENYFRNSDWCRTNTQYCICAPAEPKSKNDFALDFRFAAVRDYAFSMADELLTRYDADGLELDFTRHAYYLRFGHQREDAHYLTDFVRRVRERADVLGRARGRHIEIGVHVPQTIAVCEALGMNVVDWSREGLVDFIFPSDSYTSMPFSLPLKKWTDAIAAVSSTVTVIPGTDMNTGAVRWHYTYANLPAYRGWAVNMAAEGAEGYYLFNLPYNNLDGMPDVIYAGGITEAQRLSAGELRFACAIADFGYDPDIEGPEPEGPGGPWHVKLPACGVPDRPAEVVIGFRDGIAADGLRISVNRVGQTAAAKAVQRSSRYPDCAAVFAWDVDHASLLPGMNAISVEGADENAVYWCEIRFRDPRQEMPAGCHLVDSFEGFWEGTTADAIEGWSGEGCSVVAQTYSPPLPPGYVRPQETHAKVLNAMDEMAVSRLPESMSGNDRIEAMVCIRRPPKELKSPADDVTIQLAVDPKGRFCLWHSYEECGAWRRGWIPLSETTYADGEWVRVGIELDYTGNPSGDAFAKVVVNGSCQPTPHGVRSPTDTRAFGPWHYLAKNRCTGGASLPRELRFGGTKVDDLMLCKKTVAPEHTGATSVDGIEFSWFDNAGLPRNPLAAAPFIPGYTLGDVYTAGLDPYSDRPLEVTGFGLDANGKPHIEFNGYKGDNPSGYRVLYSTRPDFEDGAALGTSDGTFDGDATTRSTIWNGKSGAPDGAGFYKVEAIR